MLPRLTGLTPCEDRTVVPTNSTPTLNVGFLTIVREPAGFVGGFLVTNQWGRPLEFRLSTPVQPNRVQQILYAETLEPYICGDLIGKTLVDKTGQAVRLIVTDTEAALELRQRLDTPVAFVGSNGEPQSHPRYSTDGPLIQNLLDQMKGSLDLAEPFHRIREALGEARKMGVSSRV
jgi:hypothetical protein